MLFLDLSLNRMAYLNIASIRESTESEGPGKRFALWCQGCLRRCPKCCNPEMQTVKTNIIVSTSDVIALIQSAKEKFAIEGVSFIGGEPMLQSQGLCAIAKWCHANDLSVLVFTGYVLEDVKNDALPFSEELLASVDLLVDGEFIESLYDNEREWVGSTNQRVHFLTDFYKPGIEFSSKEKSMEICVTDESIAINGWPF